MENFICRVCGCESYNFEKDNWYSCSRCSTIFSSPEKFSIPTINFIKMEEDAFEPYKAHDTDTGYDLPSCEDKIIKPQTTELVKTGIAIDFPPNFGAQLRPRSGLAKKHNITIENAPATIDQGFRNQIGVLIHNSDPINEFRINKGDRIAQLILERVFLFEMKEISKDEFNKETDRGLTGYGDSGIKSK